METPQSRIIIPQSIAEYSWEDSQMEQRARLEQMTLKIPLDDGEILASLLNYDIDGDLIDEQIVAFRNLLENESPIYLSLVEYDETIREYKRTWTAATAATRPGTVTLYTQDLIGDRGTCVLLSGMNGLGEYTLTVFRNNYKEPGQNLPFTKIAEIRIDGSIVVRETERTQAYQMGMARGQSFSIAAYGRDWESSNIMDQIEIIYTYNEADGFYEQSRMARIPGAQIEQARVRELLGNARAFEEFITGLWYFVSPQRTLDSRQYIYFDPPNKEIIFYGDAIQQVFSWQTSNTSRYGLYIFCQNISVSTVRRSITIELESLESIKVKVDDDVRLNIGIIAPWDGSYRKAGAPVDRLPPPSRNAHINAVYDSSIGRTSFHLDGSFELSAGGTLRQGKYAFFNLDDLELLELRSIENNRLETKANSQDREIYLVEPVNDEDPGPDTPEPFGETSRKTITLSRVRLGARGVQMLHEGTIVLNLVE